MLQIAAPPAGTNDGEHGTAEVFAPFMFTTAIGFAIGYSCSFSIWNVIKVRPVTWFAPITMSLHRRDEEKVQVFGVTVFGIPRE